MAGRDGKGTKGALDVEFQKDELRGVWEELRGGAREVLYVAALVFFGDVSGGVNPRASEIPPARTLRLPEGQTLSLILLLRVRRSYVS